MKKSIYLDNAATTVTKKEVVDAMLPYFTEYFGNPSSIYDFALKSREAINNARKIIAKSLNTNKQDIYFTASGSESDNWALKACAKAYKNKGKHIITSKIEHHAILNTCEYLEKEGYDITYIGVDNDGVIKLDELVKAIRKDTILISIMFANNEIGTIQPIKKIGDIAKKYDVLFHTDAVQAYGHIGIDVDELNIDMLSASAHKLNGPKGVGFLYIRKGLEICSFIHGGAQERRIRAGTENVSGIVGFGKAVEIAFANINYRIQREMELRDRIINKILKQIPYTKLNGDRNNRLSNNINFSFEFIEAEALIIMLDMKGICVSSGSACTSSYVLPSHVLLSIGLSYEMAHSSLRITLSADNTDDEIDYFLDSIIEVVEILRNMSPSYKEFLNTNSKYLCKEKFMDKKKNIVEKIN